MSHQPDYGIVKFLVVEDDLVCIMAVQRSLKKLGLCNPVVVAHDGIEALSILRGDEGQAPLAAPYIIILDLNMPRMGGLEFLDEVRNDPALRRAVIFVATTSSADRDITAAYERNIAGYILKDSFHDSFLTALGMIDNYAKAVVLPT